MDQLNSFEELNISLVRSENRAPDQTRMVKITPNYIPTATGSVLIECGNTRVICVASIEEKVPRWMMYNKKKSGWVTAEYSMMPYACGSRKMREVTSGKLGGRTQEIQRLIGRSLRAAVDLKKLGERTVWIDCDVIQADGGTRTASITGGFIALQLALQKLVNKKVIKALPIIHQIAAVSVGIIDGKALLDLDYNEDSSAEVDFNVVMNDKGQFIETQGTAEEKPFTRQQLDEMLKIAEKGCGELLGLQTEIINKNN